MQDVELDRDTRPTRADLLTMTSRIVAAYAGRNDIGAGDLPGLIRSVYGCLDRHAEGVTTAQAEPEAPRKAAIPINRSVTPDYLVCLEDGKRLKMLKRHLRAAYGLTPEEYRAKWGLPPDYPMVAPNYAAERSAFAKKIGLGRNSDAGGRTAH
ncbi:MucR family transcriptional regulator [Marivibrio halodurans]|uniref:MucR family transcriptional regulator n=1 Tax=Marivibrio halodurans TaxID=2039722 RepID=A0A8J7RZK0_9PROT|nr:MucR family transcriptional regulator [Marivibrio halodurans]MBP5855944.1 MucR family transcriptional regulator [Marivibrio halodurans]